MPMAFSCSVTTDLQGILGMLKGLIPLLSSTAQLANLFGPSVNPKVSERQ